MRKKILRYLFLALVILLSSITNLCANTQNTSHFKPVNSITKSAYQYQQQNLNNTLFKPNSNSKKGGFINKNISIEDFEESEHSATIYNHTSLFGNNACAILFKLLIESNSVKTKENLVSQCFNTRTISLSLHKKFEVFIL
ncbi:hypothetical protein [Polaribacter sp. 11A2H]|uniref:hypothetical protein n=1 Tax=Polaribacter sp. 11A2H TaxID=2687290 RepID=UPI00140A2914|nr:hypothetical protein [Polaribacter sp. 11A2H]